MDEKPRYCHNNESEHWGPKVNLMSIQNTTCVTKTTRRNNGYGKTSWDKVHLSKSDQFFAIAVNGSKNWIEPYPCFLTAEMNLIFNKWLTISSLHDTWKCPNSMRILQTYEYIDAGVDRFRAKASVLRYSHMIWSHIRDSLLQNKLTKKNLSHTVIL